MDHHIDQLSSHVPTHLDELQLAVLTQQNTKFYPLKLNTINTKMKKINS